MIQRSYDPATEAEFAWALSQLKDQRFYAEGRAVLMQVYFSRFSMEEAQRVIDFLHAELPRVKIIGMSLYGDLSVQINTSKFIRMNVCQFAESEVEVFEYSASAADYTEAEISADFRTKLSAIPDAKGVLVLASGNTFKISRFMEDISEGFEHIPFFGAVANINTVDILTGSPYVFAEHTLAKGVVFAVYSGKNLYIHTDYVFGWKPIGKPLAVETGEPGAIGDTLVTKIDGIPATDIYHRYLQVEADRHFVANICEFPLAVERDGFTIARIPCAFNSRGEVSLMGDLKTGEMVRFSYGKTDDILRATWNVSADMAAFLPQGVFLYVCANRAIFMKARAREEIDNFGKITPGLLFCHGFSELYRYGGKGGVFNSTLVAVGMREGGKSVVSQGRRLVPKGLVSFNTAEGNAAAPAVRLDRNEQEDVAATERREANGELYSMFERPLGKTIPLADRLVTFLEATTADLKKATEAANAANEAKSAFLSSMSHEIRTPINAVLGLDEMILRESGEDGIRGYARDIQSSGRSLLSIINDILDFSKIEAGKMAIINADYDLRALITDLANMVEARALGNGLDFMVNVDEKMPHLLYGDETRIKQCVLNILSNAVKYTRKGSVTLDVGYAEKDSSHIMLSFRVTDTGIGIKDEDMPRLFKPFERIEESRNRSIEGTGLGMSIVNGLLKGMGTKLEVESVYGKGSVFSFTLEQELRDREPIGSREEAQKALIREASSYTESFQAPEGRILVVDDTPMNLAVIKGLLKMTRLRIDTAPDADSGLELAGQNSYHILFIDHLMPKTDGIEMLARLRADVSCKNQNTPAVALTANAVNGAKEMYLAAGFDDYLSKPIDSQKLEAMIAHYLPEKLVLRKGNAGFEERGTLHGQNAAVSQNGLGEAGEIFSSLFALDLAEALKNCGSKDTFMEAVRNFFEAIEEKAALIEGYAAAGDWKNYTVQVHALKSSARLIGALPLSAAARELEDLGNAAQKATDDGQASSGAAVEIAAKTPPLLAEYRAYLQRLAPFCVKSAVGVSQSAVPKPLISQSQLADALSALRQAVAAFDFDSADTVIAEMDGYAMPPDFAPLFAKIRQAERNVDAQAVLALLDAVVYDRYYGK